MTKMDWEKAHRKDLVRGLERPDWSDGKPRKLVDRAIRAKFHGTCPTCGQHIDPGDVIVLAADGRGAVHRNCPARQVRRWRR